MTREEFEAIAIRAIDELPVEFQPYLDNCMLLIRRRPTKSMRRRLRLRVGDDLLGLYYGADLSQRQGDQALVMPSRIYLFSEALLAYCATEKKLVREIQKTVLHEVGHHFGLSERQLRRLGY